LNKAFLRPPEKPDGFQKRGKRHRQTTVTYDRNQNRATWVEHDVLDNNKVLRRAQVDIPHCVHDVLGGAF